MNRFFISMLVVLSLVLAACAQQPAKQAVKEVPAAPEPAPAEIPAPAPEPTPPAVQQNVTIKPVPQETSMMTKSFSVDANDARAIPDSISVAKGTKFTITFRVDMDDVYYGGLQFKSSAFSSGKISPGNIWTTPEITADQSFKIGAYWPSAGVHKWDLQVTVS